MLLEFEDLIERHVRAHIDNAPSLVELVKVLPGVSLSRSLPCD